MEKKKGKTVGDLLNEMQKIKTREEGHTFLVKALEENSYAVSNIKYIAGYLGNEERNRILNLIF